jgi:hypothetical protein
MLAGVQYYLGIKELVISSCLPNVALFISVFLEILSGLLILPKHGGTSTSLPLGGAWVLICWELLLVYCHCFSTRGQYEPRFVPNTLSVCCSERTRKVPRKSSLSPQASSYGQNRPRCFICSCLACGQAIQNSARL